MLLVTKKYFKIFVKQFSYNYSFYTIEEYFKQS